MADNSLVFSGEVTGITKSVVAQYNAAQKALNQKPINIRVNDRASLPLGRISGNAQEFDKSLKAATQRVIAFGAAAGVFYTVERAFKALLAATIEVEDSLAKINVNLGQGADSLKNFSKQLFDIAKSTGQTFQTSAKAAEEFARQGLSAEETAKRVKDALLLTRLAGIDSAAAVEDLTAAVNSYGKEALSTSDIVNKFVAVDTKFAVSSKDLAEAISRVGAVAAQSGVPFDNLVGLVTSLQQTTAAGGPKIGNALKTIFTRLRSEETVKDLQDLGIAVKDIQGNFLPVGEVLQDVAKKFGSFNDVQKQFISTQIAGGFQINQLTAAFADLSKQQSIASDASKRSAGATDEAIRKNTELNNTIKSQLNITKQSVTQLFSSFGDTKLTGAFKGVVSGINDVLGALNGPENAKAGETFGQKFGENLVQGIANVITGPALGIILRLITKSFGTVFSTGLDSLKSQLNLNSNAQERAGVQQKIDTLLAKATQEEREQFALAQGTTKQKEVLLGVSQRITAETEKQVLLQRALQESLLTTSQLPGIFQQNRQPIKGIRGFAQGYNPIAAERGAIGRGVGGASTGSQPVLIGNFAQGGGKTGPVVANTSEYLVRNYANGADAIFNQNMIKSLGMPAGAQKINAAGGLIPNHAGGEFNRGDLRGQGGRFLSQAEVSNVNSVMDAIRKAGSGGEARALGKILTEFSTKLSGKSQTALLNTLGKVYTEFDKGLNSAALEAKEIAINVAKVESSRRKNAASIKEVADQEERLVPLREKLAENTKTVISRQNALKVGKVNFGENGNPGSAANAAAIQALSARGSVESDAALVKRNPLPKDLLTSSTPGDKAAAILKELKIQTAQSNAINKLTKGGVLNDREIDFLSGRVTKDILGSEEFKGLSISQINADKSLKKLFNTRQTEGLSGIFGQQNANISAQSAAAQAQRIGSASQFFAANGPGLFGSRRGDSRLLKSAGFNNPQDTALLSELLNERGQKRSNRRTSAALGASFALPFLSAFIPEGRGGTAGGIASGAAQGAAQGAGLGGLFGPIGVAIGGAGGGILGALSKLRKSTEELAKDFELRSEKGKDELETATSLVQAYQDLRDSVKEGASPAIIGRREANVRNLQSRVSPSVANTISSGNQGDIDKLLNKLRDTLATISRNGALTVGAKSLNTLSNNQSGFEEFVKNLSGGINKDNAKNIDTGVLDSLVNFNPNSEKDKANLEKLKDYYKTLGVDTEEIGLRVSRIPTFAVALKSALQKAKDGFADTDKAIQDIKKGLPELSNTAFLSKSDPAIYSKFAQTGRGANAYQSKYAKSQNTFDVLNDLIQQGGIDAKGLETDPTYRKTRAIVQRGNVLGAASSFLSARNPGARYQDQFGNYAAQSITDSLKQYEKNPNGDIATVAKLLGQLLERSSNTLKNLQNAGVNTAADGTSEFGYEHGVKVTSTNGDKNNNPIVIGLKQSAEFLDKTVDKLSASVFQTSLQLNGTIKVISDTLSEDQLNALAEDLTKRIGKHFDAKIRDVNRKVSKDRGKPEPVIADDVAGEGS